MNRGVGEIGEAPPVAEEASRFRGSAPIGGHNSGWESGGTTVGNRRPLRKVTYSAMGRDDVGIVPYGCIIDSAVADPSVTAMPRQLPLRRGAPLGTETVRGRTRLFPVA